MRIGQYNKMYMYEDKRILNILRVRTVEEQIMRIAIVEMKPLYCIGHNTKI